MTQQKDDISRKMRTNTLTEPDVIGFDTSLDKKRIEKIDKEDSLFEVITHTDKNGEKDVVVLESLTPEALRSMSPEELTKFIKIEKDLKSNLIVAIVDVIKPIVKEIGVNNKQHIFFEKTLKNTLEGLGQFFARKVRYDDNK